MYTFPRNAQSTLVFTVQHCQFDQSKPVKLLDSSFDYKVGQKLAFKSVKFTQQVVFG